MVLVVISPIMLAVGVLALWRRPRDPAARLLFLASIVLVTALNSAPVTLAGLLHPLAYSLTIWLSPWQLVLIPALAHLLLVFPVVKPPVRAHPRLTVLLLYVVPNVLAWVVAYVSRGDPARVLGRYYEWLGVQVGLTFGLMAVSGVHTLITVREAVARAQMRWVITGLLVGFVGGSSLWYLGVVFFGFSGVLPILAALFFMLMPVCLAVAILRYRLFDIDILLNRALVYGSLTALLALAYFASVVVLQGVFQIVSGQGGSELVTVLSTLAIAALFSPLRVRVQRAIDRRFYRRRYNAARTLMAFGATLRDDVNLGVLRQRLVAVVEETMQPSHVSLWLRSGAGPDETDA
jgi:hypothetical protein